MVFKYGGAALANFLAVSEVEGIVTVANVHFLPIGDPPYTYISILGRPIARPKSRQKWRRVARFSPAVPQLARISLLTHL